MKKIVQLIVFILLVQCSAQTETFDIITYKAPEGWTKETRETAVMFTKIDGGSWSQIIIYKNTISKGNIQKDFDSEWQSLVADVNKGISKPDKTKPETAEGWTVMSGSGVWKFNGNNVGTILTTYSGYGACVSIVCNATATPYLDIYHDFIGTVELYNGKDSKNQTVQNNNDSQNSNQNHISISNPKKDQFAFNTTNWDDGWISTVQEDWVEITKGNIKILLHYPKEGTIFPADPDKLTNAAWNILVAPRYSNLKNYKTAYVETSNRPYFGMGNMKENSTGKQVFVLLFRRSAGWMEIITPDSKVFTQEFGFNPETIRWGKTSEWTGGYVVDNSQNVIVSAEEPEIFNKLDNMTGRNKFAVDASDLENTGEWKDNFSSNTFYANYYTGTYAGMSTYSSSQWFVFKTGKKYHWELVSANSYGGRTDVAQGKNDGTYSVPNNWQIKFSNISNKPKLYDAYFSAVKNGRILWLNDHDFPGSGIFTGFARKQ